MPAESRSKRNGFKDYELDLNNFFKDPIIKKFVEAVEVGNAIYINELVTNGVNVNTQGINGATPLMYSIVKGNLDGVMRLLDMGAEPNIKDDNGYSASVTCCWFR